MLLLEDGKICDVFELVELGDAHVRVRAPFLFELGEQLALRIEREGTVQEATARVRAHVASGEGRISELEVLKLGELKRVVSG